MRFALPEEQSENQQVESSPEPETVDDQDSLTPVVNSDKPGPSAVFPPSVSIDTLLKAGKLVKPVATTKVKLTLESYDIATKTWIKHDDEEMAVEDKHFAEGAFRFAYNVRASSGKRFVLKTYKDKTKETIENTTKSTPENHCRKQVQMHEVACYVADHFSSKAPPSFGRCFKYNKCYFVMFGEKPATLEEYVPGTFYKAINNDGECRKPPVDSSIETKEMYAKAECLVHYSSFLTDGKLMLLDIQGSGYILYDPEIASDDLQDIDSDEFYFCCGNCSIIGINTFKSNHVCNDFCKHMKLPRMVRQ